MYILPGNDAAAPLEHRNLVDRRFDGPVLPSPLHGLEGFHVVPEAGGVRARPFVGLAWGGGLRCCLVVAGTVAAAAFMCEYIENTPIHK